MEKLISTLASLRFTFPVGIGIGAALALAILCLRRRRQGYALDQGYWEGKVDLRSRRGWVMAVLVAVTALVMTAALGAPEVVAKEKVHIYGKPVLAVIDVSGSMDYQAKNRTAGPATAEPMSNLDQARAVFDDILSRDLGMDFGVVLYSTENYIARYFAFKKDLIKDSLDNEEEIAFIATGTRTAEALAAARRFLVANAGAGDKAILLVSDLQGDLEALVAMAEEMENCVYAGVRLYVITIGDDRGKKRVKKPALPVIEGVMMVDRNDKEGVERLTREMAALADSPVSEEETAVTRPVTPWLAVAALVLAALTLALSESRFRRIA